jgi:hypothetical protein
MSFKNRYEQQRAIEAAGEQQAKRDCLAQVYDSRQDFMRCMANDHAILEFITAWSGNPDILPTKELFDQALMENPDAVKTFARMPLEEAKDQVIEEYLEKLAAHSRQDRFSLKQEESRLRHQSLEVCRQKLSDLKLRQKMAALPVGTLKALVKEAHVDSRPFPGFPTLPQQLYENGRYVAVNAEYLKNLDGFSIRRLCRLYSSDQITARLRGER